MSKKEKPQKLDAIDLEYKIEMLERLDAINLESAKLRELIEKKFPKEPYQPEPHDYGSLNPETARWAY